MKVFDATSLIAFLSDMKFPEGLELLSKHYCIIVPEGVAAEIKKSPSKALFKGLVDKGMVQLTKVDPAASQQIQSENPQLHLGECEVIAFALARNPGQPTAYLLSDDKVARNKFPSLNFKWTEELLKHMEKKAIIDRGTYDKKINQLRSSSFYYRGRSK